MNRDKLSVRQLSVAALVGGLSHAAAFSGSMDWRWTLAATPLGIGLSWFLLRRTSGSPLFQGAGGKVLAILYGGWSLILQAVVLHWAVQRLQTTNGSRGGGFWVLLLIAVPLLWIGWRESAAFFRAVEIFWLAIVALLGAVLLFAVPRMEWKWLLQPAGEWRQTVPSIVLILSTGWFSFPYIYKVEGNLSRGLVWQGVLGVLAAVLAAVTVGLLSPAVAAGLEQPFFTASGVLGESVRAEGLISALWLLPDLALAGLLSRVWGERWRAVVGTVLACVLALTGVSSRFSVEILAVGTLLLALLTALTVPGKRK